MEKNEKNQTDMTLGSLIGILVMCWAVCFIIGLFVPIIPYIVAIGITILFISQYIHEKHRS